MGSLAVSRRAAAETADQPVTSIADEIASIARKELAPLAAAIDSGEVYPDELLRRLGEAGAWGSHVPKDGEADMRCAIQSIAATTPESGDATSLRCRSSAVSNANRAPRNVAKSPTPANGARAPAFQTSRTSACRLISSHTGKPRTAAAFPG